MHGISCTHSCIEDRNILYSKIKSLWNSGEHSSKIVLKNAESEARAVDPDYAKGHNVMFSDGFPFLLLSQVSQVEKLKSKFFFVFDESLFHIRH